MIHIIVPTVEGRERNLELCLRGYREHTDGETTVHVVKDLGSCGLAWQEGARRAEAFGAADDDHLHFTADDIVPGEGWFPPMAEATARNQIPMALVVTAVPQVLDGDGYPLPGNPLGPVASFFEGPAPVWPYRVWPDWMPSTSDSEYPSVPFCTMRQWRNGIGPMIASHYGTDKWFGHRAKCAGYTPVVRHGALFYHFAAQEGRVPKGEGWYHVDRITFDQVIAYPDYLSGRVAPEQVHPLHYTPEGLRKTREWYTRSVPGPYPWDA